MHSPWHRVPIIPVILLAFTAALPALATAPPSVKIAVFDFELEDVSAAGAASMGDAAGDSTRMHAVTDEARRVLAQSGRFSIVDTNGVDAQLWGERGRARAHHVGRAYGPCRSIACERGARVRARPERGGG